MSCLNLAYSGNAKITFHNFPNLSLMVQEFALPGVSVTYPSVQGPIARTPLGATGIRYEPLSAQFLIGENFESYIEILKWLQSAPTKRHADIFSDVTISLLSNSKTPLIDVAFTNVTPVALNAVPFNVNLPEPQPLKAVATFDYTNFDFKV